MGLRLHSPAPSRGFVWLKLGFATFVKRPLAFVGLFAFFLFGALALMLVPWIGGLLGMALLPMLTLGFMIATRSTLAGGPVAALQLLEGLRSGAPAQRRAQALLCVAYAAGSVLILLLAGWVDDGAFERVQIALATGASEAELSKLFGDPHLAWGMAVRFGLATLLSVPFWHAPALVHWGGQGAWQALFSSTLALWRAKGAFICYSIGWAAVMLLLGTVLSAAALASGRAALGMLSMPLGLVVTAAFYVSLWFSFADSFGDEADAAPRG
ncbi:MAG: hypothetical protein HY021_07180 [Burkholderiales bacterium]|nr:hypothetical protein [Burkholderiales bacterium]